MDGDYNVLVQKCKIFNNIAYIVRADINNKAGGAHTLNIIEIVSSKNLRKEYKLKNNDEIEITIEK